MAINPAQAANSNYAPTPAPANPKGDMDKNTFMKLLVAELKQQDPMDPMQAREMVGQLSQLSSVEKLNSIDEKLSSLQNLSAASSGIANAGLIGRQVVADAHTLLQTGKEAVNGGFNLPSAADKVQIKIRDSAGQLVKTMELGAQKLGPNTFSWSGDTDKGNRAPVGSYTFEVTAKAANGNPVVASTRVTGLVTEVSYEGGAPEVIVGGARIPLGDVVSIAQ
ncbi:MAG TPA: FlgD immunoglobulin-like domain containing protein [Polyangiales bacterium]|nr:FlgD immunoglobulin-like domain containing protein [Polyangiales bacterium]